MKFYKQYKRVNWTHCHLQDELDHSLLLYRQRICFQLMHDCLRVTNITVMTHNQPNLSKSKVLKDKGNFKNERYVVTLTSAINSSVRIKVLTVYCRNIHLQCVSAPVMLWIKPKSELLSPSRAWDSQHLNENQDYLSCEKKYPTEWFFPSDFGEVEWMTLQL